MTSETPQQFLPWSHTELELLLRDLIAHGTETPKADCKAEIETGTNDGKAELLKDITAIANTYGEEFNDYGFLIYGVTGKTIAGVANTQTNTDKLQSHIEQLLKSYIAPMPQIYVIGFLGQGGEQWGAIVIPPRHLKPHMFVKDIQCADHRRSRKRGDWFVRRGTTTDSGLPEDLSRIFQRQTELALEPLRESLRSLQLRIARTEAQYDTALLGVMQRVASGLDRESREDLPERQLEIADDLGARLGRALSSRLRQRLQKPADVLANDLIAEALQVREFTEGGNTTVRWDLQPIDAQAAVNKAFIEAIEQRIRPLLVAVATVLIDDNEGSFTGALLRVVKMLARSGAPVGVTYTQVGLALRDYPLALLLYVVFVCGAWAKRGETLKQILNIPLRERSGDRRSNILDIFFRAHRAKELFDTAFGVRSCEPIALRARQVIGDSLGELLPGIPEPEYFFRGEFVLALAPIDLGITQKRTPEQIGPLPGLYLYFGEANDVVRDFFSERPDWLATLYRNPVPDLLALFDRNAQKVVRFECFGTGLYGLSTLELYQMTE